MTQDSKVSKTKLKRDIEPEQRAVLYTDRTPSSVVLNGAHLPRAFQQLQSCIINHSSRFWTNFWISNRML